MKTKLLVAMIACLAIGACSKHEAGKEDKKAGAESTQKTEAQPAGAAPAPGDHSSMNEGAATLAAGEQNAATSSAATPATQDADKKVEDMKQDMSNTANQVQGANTTSSTSTDAAKADAQPHAED